MPLRPALPAPLQCPQSKTGDTVVPILTLRSSNIRLRYSVRVITIPPRHATIISSSSSIAILARTATTTTITTTTIIRTISTTTTSTEVAVAVAATEQLATENHPTTANNRRAITKNPVISISVASRIHSSSTGGAVGTTITTTTMMMTSWWAMDRHPIVTAMATLATTLGYNRPFRMRRVTSMAHQPTTILITISTIAEEEQPSIGLVTPMVAYIASNSIRLVIKVSWLTSTPTAVERQS